MKGAPWALVDTGRSAFENTKPLASRRGQLRGESGSLANNCDVGELKGKGRLCHRPGVLSCGS